ncbi:MAG: thiamine phosphate synthase [Candidatus Omnitrophica bacterium]|nr:thiamine phosphate synthase [Candidatus Omnitrophota bacterium]
MSWKNECLKNFRLYAITDLKSPLTPALSPGGRKGEGSSKILADIEGAFRGGVDIVQLRSNVFSDRVLLELGEKIRRITQKVRKLFIVNDRVDLMLAMDADGVHLGQEDLPIDIARRMIGNRKKIIGKSTHSLKQALQAEREGADYIGFGPIFETPTKPTYPPVGLQTIREVMKRIKIPMVCIGGIDPTNVKQVIEAGAHRIAVVRAIFGVPDVYQAACHLRGLMEHD